MVYSWGLFWPRELGVLNQRRISPSLQGPRGENSQAGEWDSRLGRNYHFTARERENDLRHLLCLFHPPVWPSWFCFSRLLHLCTCACGDVCWCVCLKCCTALKLTLLLWMSTCMYLCRPALQMMLPIWRGQELAERLCQLCVTKNTW